jgi:hypothetical protein
MRFNELMTGARQDVVCKIYGEDLDTLAVYAHKLGELVSSVEGAKDLYVESVGGPAADRGDLRPRALALRPQHGSGERRGAHGLRGKRCGPGLRG